MGKKRKTGPKPIKFDDLAPKQQVRGGRKTIFGASLLAKGRKEG